MSNKRLDGSSLNDEVFIFPTTQLVHNWCGDFMISSTSLASVFLQVAFTFMGTSQPQCRVSPSRLETDRWIDRKEGGEQEGRKGRRQVGRQNRQEKVLSQSETRHLPKSPQQISIYISLAVAGSFLPTRETGKYF